MWLCVDSLASHRNVKITFRIFLLLFVRFVSWLAPEHRLKILLFCEASLLIFLSFAPAYLLKLWIPVPLVHLQFISIS